jgi:hypothetical protein
VKGKGAKEKAAKIFAEFVYISFKLLRKNVTIPSIS